MAIYPPRVCTIGAKIYSDCQGQQPGGPDLSKAGLEIGVETHESEMRYPEKCRIRSNRTVIRLNVRGVGLVQRLKVAMFPGRAMLSVRQVP